MIMTKTPMMAPIIPRFTSPPSIRVLTATSDPAVEHEPVADVGVRAAGSECRTLARSRSVYNSTTQRADALHP
jgi:hypothetical protein